MNGPACYAPVGVNHNHARCVALNQPADPGPFGDQAVEKAINAYIHGGTSRSIIESAVLRELIRTAQLLDEVISG